jgi:hypothetical protein
MQVRAKMPARWKVGASLRLPIGRDDHPWDCAAARASIFAIGDARIARKAHLVSNSASPRLKASYKLPFARVTTRGQLAATPAGLRAAARQLAEADLPAGVKVKAAAVLAYYRARLAASAKPAARWGWRATLEAALALPC